MGFHGSNADSVINIGIREFKYKKMDIGKPVGTSVSSSVRGSTYNIISRSIRYSVNTPILEVATNLIWDPTSDIVFDSIWTAVNRDTWA